MTACVRARPSATVREQLEARCWQNTVQHAVGRTALRTGDSCWVPPGDVAGTAVSLGLSAALDSAWPVLCAPCRHLETVDSGAEESLARTGGRQWGCAGSGPQPWWEAGMGRPAGLPSGLDARAAALHSLCSGFTGWGIEDGDARQGWTARHPLPRWGHWPVEKPSDGFLPALCPGLTGTSSS